MANNKQKKIKKARKNIIQQPPAEDQHQGQQQIIDNRDNIFEGMVEQEVQPEPIVMDQESVKRVAKCEVGKGWMFLLDVGRTYKIVNKNSTKVDVMIIDGTVDVNGKTFYRFFKVKEEGNLIITALKTENKLTQSKKAQKIAASTKASQLISKFNLKWHQMNDNFMIVQLSPIHKEYLADFKSNQNVLLWSQSSIEIIDDGRNFLWHDVDIAKFLAKPEVTMLVGLKNTGKSMFCEFLLNQAQKNKQGFCLLDIDIGKNIKFPGCVTLAIVDSKQGRKGLSLWIGEYTPLNNISDYMKAIKELFEYYKQNYYTYGLVVNTMGYLTGVGELLIYEAFNIVKPHRVQAMKSGDKQDWVVDNLLDCLKNGNYIERLHFGGQQNTKTSTKIERYVNELAEQKRNVQRFEAILTSEPVKSLDQLIMLMVSGKMSKIPKTIEIYRKSNTAISQIQFSNGTSIEMRIVLLGKFWKEGLFMVAGVGYGWNGQIYYDQGLVAPNQIEVGLVSDGVDFERSFYQVNEARLIEIEESIGRRIPFIQPFFKVLGSKGIRNNPGKKITNN